MQSTMQVARHVAGTCTYIQDGRGGAVGEQGRYGWNEETIPDWVRLAPQLPELRFIRRFQHAAAT